MKHAGEEALDRLEGLLKRIRDLPGLVERKRGTFYKKSQAFLHFHEDPEGLFADMKAKGSWKRFRVSSKNEQVRFLRSVTDGDKTGS